MNTLGPILARNPKAKPLALTLIAAAAEQGASAEELRIACDLAIRAYEEARDNSAVPLSAFQGEAEAALREHLGIPFPSAHWSRPCGCA